MVCVSTARLQQIRLLDDLEALRQRVPVLDDTDGPSPAAQGWLRSVANQLGQIDAPALASFQQLAGRLSMPVSRPTKELTAQNLLAMVDGVMAVLTAQASSQPSQRPANPTDRLSAVLADAQETAFAIRSGTKSARVRWLLADLCQEFDRTYHAVSHKLSKGAVTAADAVRRKLWDISVGYDQASVLGSGAEAAELARNAYRDINDLYALQERMREEFQAMNTLPSPIELLREASRQAPVVKWAFGVVGLGAAGAIIYSLFSTPRLAIATLLAMLVIMALLIVVSRVADAKPATFHGPVVLLAWGLALLFLAVAGMTITTVFFQWPIAWSSLSEVVSADRAPSVSPPHVAPEIAEVVSFAPPGRYVEVGCEGITPEIRVEFAVPDDAFEIQHSCAWVGVDNVKEHNCSTTASGRTVTATGRISGLDTEFGNCPGGGHGTLQLSGSYKH